MTPKHFASLAAAAALSLIVAIAVHAARQPSAPGASGTTPLFPSLAAGKVARVSVTQGGTTLTLEKSGDEKSGERWVMKSQDGYPASTDKVRALIAALSNARLLEAKTALPARYSASRRPGRQAFERPPRPPGRCDRRASRRGHRR